MTDRQRQTDGLCHATKRLIKSLNERMNYSMVNKYRQPKIHAQSSILYRPFPCCPLCPQFHSRSLRFHISPSPAYGDSFPSSQSM